MSVDFSRRAFTILTEMSACHITALLIPAASWPATPCSCAISYHRSSLTNTGHRITTKNAGGFLNLDTVTHASKVKHVTSAFYSIFVKFFKYLNILKAKTIHFEKQKSMNISCYKIHFIFKQEKTYLPIGKKSFNS